MSSDDAAAHASMEGATRDQEASIQRQSAISDGQRTCDICWAAKLRMQKSAARMAQEDARARLEMAATCAPRIVRDGLAWGVQRGSLDDRARALFHHVKSKRVCYVCGIARVEGELSLKSRNRS